MQFGSIVSLQRERQTCQTVRPPPDTDGHDRDDGHDVFLHAHGAHAHQQLETVGCRVGGHYALIISDGHDTDNLSRYPIFPIPILDTGIGIESISGFEYRAHHYLLLLPKFTGF